MLHVLLYSRVYLSLWDLHVGLATFQMIDKYALHRRATTYLNSVQSYQCSTTE